MDSVQREQLLALQPTERIVVFHFSEILPTAAALERGGEVIHLLGKGLSFQDIRYHLPKRCTNPAFHADVEQWLM
jgi:hypothetical protein